MKQDRDYFQDIVEIRSMMERSSKFVTISGWSGILAGIYALVGAYVAYAYFGFDPEKYHFSDGESLPAALPEVIGIAVGVLVLALGTAIFYSQRKAVRKGEKIWNPTSKRLLVHLAVPLFTGGIVMLILLSKGFVGLMLPLSLLFYGLALYSTSKFTYEWVKVLGLVQIILGLICTYFIEYSVWIWALGFGVVHIIYGIYMHLKYER